MLKQYGARRGGGGEGKQYGDEKGIGKRQGCGLAHAVSFAGVIRVVKQHDPNNGCEEDYASQR